MTLSLKPALNGWQEIKGTVWNGTLANATATFSGERDCSIQLAGKSAANFFNTAYIRFVFTFALYHNQVPQAV